MAVGRSWEGLRLGVGAVLVLAVAFWLASRFVSPAPPRQIEIASGAAGGAYAMFAERYGSALAEHGIELAVRHTSGSVENLELLQAGEVDVALVQTGVADPDETDGLQSLGALFHEPLWLFVEKDLPFERLSDLRGLRSDVGPEGSGTRALASRLLTMTDVTAANSTWTGFDAEERQRAIVESRLDALFAVGSVRSPEVRRFLADDRLRLQDLRRPATSRLWPRASTTR